MRWQAKALFCASFCFLGNVVQPQEVNGFSGLCGRTQARAPGLSQGAEEVVTWITEAIADEFLAFRNYSLEEMRSGEPLAQEILIEPFEPGQVPPRVHVAYSLEGYGWVVRELVVSHENKLAFFPITFTHRAPGFVSAFTCVHDKKDCQVLDLEFPDLQRVFCCWWQAAIPPFAAQGSLTAQLLEAARKRNERRQELLLAQERLGEGKDAPIPLLSGEGARIRTLADGAEGAAISNLAFSPDGKFLAVARTDGQVRLWDVGEGKLVKSWQTKVPVLSVVFSSNGRLLAASTDPGGNVKKASNGEVLLWDVLSGRLVKSFHPEGSPAEALLFSPRDRCLLLRVSH